MLAPENQERCLKSGTTRRTHLAVDNDQVLVSGLKNGGMRLQNIETGAVKREFEKDSNKHLSALQLAADRKSFVGIMHEGDGQTVRQWEISTGKVLAEHLFSVPNRKTGERFGGLNPFLALGGSRLVQLEQVVPAKKLDDGSIDWGKMELWLTNWKTQSNTDRLRVPAIGRFNYADSGDGTTLAAVVSDGRSPPGYGEAWGSTHLLIWDTATGWERLRVNREMHNHFDAFSLVAVAVVVES